ncbi:hypothetical protein SAMN05421823_102714 [Catalinimonas alkaloidigena]|uniref:Uncharacterized protein n=1 Tax=Catalinimonas alkaloidigena TaxID=1075417 RepID=A0A1G9BUF2_9BACT|nr:hypothetical protein [Catalinimonas alkaloidigena]SDK43023.1 hypothetical protein SAMN05421823_102714 [Catalinimonas alkaloidigena]
MFTLGELTKAIDRSIELFYSRYDAVKHNNDEFREVADENGKVIAYSFDHHDAEHGLYRREFLLEKDISKASHDLILEAISLIDKDLKQLNIENRIPYLNHEKGILLGYLTDDGNQDLYKKYPSIKTYIQELLQCIEDKIQVNYTVSVFPVKKVRRKKGAKLSLDSDYIGDKYFNYSDKIIDLHKQLTNRGLLANNTREDFVRLFTNRPLENTMHWKGSPSELAVLFSTLHNKFNVMHGYTNWKAIENAFIYDRINSELRTLAGSASDALKNSFLALLSEIFSGMEKKKSKHS